MSELKPCPFCGGAAELDYGRSFRAMSSGNIEQAVAIYCLECSADMALCRSDHREYDAEQLADILTENWNRRATLEGDALPVAVKALEWQDLGNGFSRAPAPLFGSIRVEHYGDDFTVCYSVPGFSDTFTEGSFATLDAAKAAAQADYESRIRSALVSPSSDSLRKLEVAREALRNVLPTLEELAEKRGLSFSEAGGLADDVRAALSQLEKSQDAGEMG